MKAISDFLTSLVVAANLICVYMIGELRADNMDNLTAKWFLLCLMLMNLTVAVANIKILFKGE